MDRPAVTLIVVQVSVSSTLNSTCFPRPTLTSNSGVVMLLPPWSRSMVTPLSNWITPLPTTTSDSVKSGRSVSRSGWISPPKAAGLVQQHQRAAVLGGENAS